MESIKELLKIDYSTFIITIFMILAGIIAAYKIVSEFCEIIKKPFGEAKQKKEEHDLLLKTVEDLKELHDKHEEDTKQSIRHDKMIRDDLQNLTITVNNIANKLEVMQEKSDATEMAKLKDKIVAYYRKYSVLGEWERFEHDVFWGLFDSYISHGGNSFVKDEIEPIMRNLQIKD